MATTTRRKRWAAADERGPLDDYRESRNANRHRGGKRFDGNGSVYDTRWAHGEDDRRWRRLDRIHELDANIREDRFERRDD